MRINTIKPNNLNFKSALLNINAASDTHGQLHLMSDFYSTIEKNKNELFLEEKRGNKNVFALAGDWFMAGDVKGYKSNPSYNSQKYQLIFFNKFVQAIHKIKRHTQFIFSIGNHEFDAGVKEFVKTMERLHAKIILTNANFENSPSIKELINKKKILKSQVIKIQDDKNPKKFHKALFVSTAPGNMSYYNKKIKGIDFSDNVFKTQSLLTYEDVQNSIEAIKIEIEKFKKENPKGAVILMDHFAGTFQKELLKQKLPIDVILSAHEHYDDEKVIGKTLIVNLLQNFEKLENIKIKFDDEGNIEEIKGKTYRTLKDSKRNIISDFYEKIFKKDIEKKYSIPALDDVKLNLEGIRVQNSYLANYITDVIAHKIKEKYDIDFFALNASAIRGPLLTQKEGEIDNTRLLTILNGIKEEDADILISKVTGQELCEIVCENIMLNKNNPKRNPLLQFSGLKINKTLMLNLLEHKTPSQSLCHLITTCDGEEIQKDKVYYMANVEKFFLKTKNPTIKSLYYDKTRTHKTSINAKKAFQQYFEEDSKDVVAKKEIRYY